MGIDRAQIEDGIWPLVEAANLSGHATVSSCEGHAEKERPASVVFLASNEETLRIHLAIRQIYDELLCHWELTARYIYHADAWKLGWNLQNCGVKDCEKPGGADWWNENTEAARKDVARLAALLLSTGTG